MIDKGVFFRTALIIVVALGCCLLGMAAARVFQFPATIGDNGVTLNGIIMAVVFGFGVVIYMRYVNRRR